MKLAISSSTLTLLLCTACGTEDPSASGWEFHADAATIPDTPTTGDVIDAGGIGFDAGVECTGNPDFVCCAAVAVREYDTEANERIGGPVLRTRYPNEVDPVCRTWKEPPEWGCGVRTIDREESCIALDAGMHH